MTFLRNLDWVLPLIVILIPLVVKALRLISSITTNERIATLTERAAIIVEALEREDINKMAKKNEGVRKLLDLAEELKINLNSEQASDYIESAVTTLREIQKQNKGEQ